MSAVVLHIRRPGQPIGQDRYAEYHRRLQAWVDEQLSQPTVQPGAYEQAAKCIAAECGI